MVDEQLELWDQYVNVARKIAGRFSRIYGRRYEDVLDVAEFALADALYSGRFDPSRGTKRITFVYSSIHYFLLNVYTRGVHPRVSVREAREIPVSDTDVDPTTREAPSRGFPERLRDLYEEVSEEGRTLLRVILEAPEEIAEEMKPSRAKKARTAVRNYLVDELDWKWEQLDAAWEEVRAAVEGA